MPTSTRVRSIMKGLSGLITAAGNLLRHITSTVTVDGTVRIYDFAATEISIATSSSMSLTELAGARVTLREQLAMSLTVRDYAV